MSRRLYPLEIISSNPAIAIVLIQTIGCAWRISFDARAAQNENVHPAIIVVVEEGASATHHLENDRAAFVTMTGLPARNYIIRRRASSQNASGVRMGFFSLLEAGPVIKDVQERPV